MITMKNSSAIINSMLNLDTLPYMTGEEIVNQ